MTIAKTRSDVDPIDTNSSQKVRAATGSTIGAIIENYDFLAYGTAAALYLGPAFFPSNDPLVSTLSAFAALGVGFLMRPVGGIIAGHLGDRIGRKPVLVGALILMGIGTVLIGILPTYETIGVAAPILLVLLRLVQGIGYGAEWGGAVLMAFEHAPIRRRGFYAAIPQIGVPAGLLLANVAFLSVTGITDDWAWRIPFLFSAVLVFVGLWIRYGVNESPEFEQAKLNKQLVKNPVGEVLRRDGKTVLQAICLRLAETCGFYVVVTFLLTYLVQEDIATKETGLFGVVLASIIGLVSHPIYGALSDRFGRKTVYICGSAFTTLFAIPLFLLINTGNAVLIITAMVLALVLGHDSLAGVQSSWFPELFDTSKRTSGASLGYQGAAVIAGFVPFIATGLWALWGWVGVSVLIVIVGLISLIAALITPETAPVKTGLR
ncbi:MFS transporter [Cryobacterium sp. Y82]|uniref:MFS transporter n=1 Tax=Cryobacterium sp. Y82 TaxID=2045017 RepID=UPI000CE2D442|nr:MFS transporter [Cryobacterium sp. Y82]